LTLPFEGKIAAGDLSTGASQRVHPAMHPAFRILDVFIVKPFF
jgi:hypothetical protein